MYTQCPHCRTIFEINRKQVKAARGEVRCGHCHNVFNASKFKLKRLPEEDTETSYAADNEELEPLPDILRDEPSAKREGTAWVGLLMWGIVGFILAMILIGQVIWLQHPDRILQHSYIRPILVQACAVLNCNIPTLPNPNAFHMQNHNAYVPNDYENVIRFDGEFMNQTNTPQSYPTLQLTFQNAGGQSIAQRQFNPAEYRLGKSHNPRERIPAGATVNLRLEIVDVSMMLEGGQIMEGYRFEFL